MKLREIYEDIDERCLDLQLENVYSSLNESANVTRQDMSRIQGKKMEADFYETGDGDSMVFVSDGGRTEAVVFNNREVVSAEQVTGGQKRELISEYDAKKVRNKRIISRIVKTALIVIGLGLITGGTLYIFGPTIIAIAGMMWNVVSFAGGMAASIASALGGGLATGASAGGGLIAALVSALSKYIIAGAAITGGLITLQIASDVKQP